jgi:1-acyl-sn-glycerol-3-phosphate acyltransferase
MRPPACESWSWTVLTWLDVGFWLALVILPAVVLGLWGLLTGDKRRRLAAGIVTAAFRAIVRSHPRYRLTLSGLENLPPGPALLCANHQSLADVVCLFSLPRQIRWIIKEELFRVPGFGAAMRSAGYLRIRRGDPASARVLADKVRASLAAGITVFTFPEGTRSAYGEIGPFSAGAARMAIAAQAPLVPVGISGTDWVLPKGSFKFPADAHVAIHVGPSIRTTGLTRREARSLTARVRQEVIAAKARALAQLTLATQKKGRRFGLTRPFLSD